MRFKLTFASQIDGDSTYCWTHVWRQAGGWHIGECSSLNLQCDFPQLIWQKKFRRLIIAIKQFFAVLTRTSGYNDPIRRCSSKNEELNSPPECDVGIEDSGGKLCRRKYQKRIGKSYKNYYSLAIMTHYLMTERIGLCEEVRRTWLLPTGLYTSSGRIFMIRNLWRASTREVNWDIFSTLSLFNTSYLRYEVVGLNSI